MPFSSGSGSVIESFGKGDIGGATVNAIAKTASLPTRLITAQDELAKQLVYRGRIYGSAWREATEQGLQGDAKVTYIQTALDQAFDASGTAAIDESLPSQILQRNQDALLYAQKGTFTSSLRNTPTWLGGKSIGELTQSAASQAPIIRQFVPFVKVPVNLQRFFWTHTPGINLLQKEFTQDLLTSGPEKRAEAFSKMVTGGALWTTGMTLAANGMITGSPSPALSGSSRPIAEAPG